MIQDKRRWVLLFATVALLAMILLASGIRGLELAPGKALPRFGEVAQVLEGGGQAQAAPLLTFLLRAFSFIFVLLLPFAIVYLIISPEARKRALRDLVLLLLLVGVYLLVRGRSTSWSNLGGEIQGAAPVDGPAAPSVEFVASPPPWLVWATTLALAVAIAGGVLGVAWYIWRRAHPRVSPLEQLGREAQEALVALQGGADLKDTVMRCYFEMSRAVMQQKGIQRDEAMTPREFEVSLTEIGLPPLQVRELTRLFEDVRYGAKTPDEGEERQAVDCLKAIVRACGGTA